MKASTPSTLLSTGGAPPPRRGPTAPYYLVGVLGLAIVRLTIHISSSSTGFTTNTRTTQVVQQSQLLPSPQENESRGGCGSSSSLCVTNPYLGALAESLDEISSRMDLWLNEIGHHHETAMYETNHDYGRFVPFTTMANCTEKSCVGGRCGSDTSKIVCGMKELTHVTTSAKTDEKCIIYSIGGNNKWEFEVALLQDTPCEVHTFDCTGPVSRFQKPDHDRLIFHHVCLGTRHEDAPPECVGTEKCGETWTLLEMQRSLGHNHIDLFKIDIEGYEWPLFESWPELADAHSPEVVLPYQILVEIHYQTQFANLRNPGVNRRADFRFGRDMVNLQAHLLRMGYVVVERDDNRSCPHCTELTLVRARCHDRHSTTSR